MKFEVRKASDSSYREVVKVNSIGDLMAISIREGPSCSMCTKNVALVVDFGKPESWEKPLYFLDADGTVTIYDDYL